jgi:ribosomal protein S27AE
MSKVKPESVDEAVKECRSCGESVLAVYLEDGLCDQCHE